MGTELTITWLKNRNAPMVNSTPPSTVPAIVAATAQPPCTRPMSAGLKPWLVRNGIAMALSRPSGQR